MTITRDSNGFVPLAMTGASPIYLGSDVSFSVTTPALGDYGKVTFKQSANQQISAKLYISYVKSKLTKLQQEKIKRRLAKLQKLVAYSQDMGQQALYEELTKEVAVLVRESEMDALGIKTFVDKNSIEKFKNQVKDRVIKLDTLENFPRVIPANVQRKLKGLKKSGIFDEYHILFVDYTDQKLKTNKEKIREKDPILFGKLQYQPDRFYYIADWVDEYCDLTLNKMVDTIRLDDPEFELSKIEDIDQNRWDGIVNEVKERLDRLKNTNVNNYRDLMKEEEKKKLEAELRQKIKDEMAQTAVLTVSEQAPVVKNKSWWKFW